MSVDQDGHHLARHRVKGARHQLHVPFEPQTPLQHYEPVLHSANLGRHETQLPLLQALLQHMECAWQNSPTGRHAWQVLVVMPQNCPQQSLWSLQGVVCVQHTPPLQMPEHVPQLPPQPSLPQTLPAQLGTHWHWPWVLQVSFAAQVPQVPPQPSSPHFLAPHEVQQAPALTHDSP